MPERRPGPSPRNPRAIAGAALGQSPGHPDSQPPSAPGRGCRAGAEHRVRFPPGEGSPPPQTRDPRLGLASCAAPVLARARRRRNAPPRQHRSGLLRRPPGRCRTVPWRITLALRPLANNSRRTSHPSTYPQSAADNPELRSMRRPMASTRTSREAKTVTRSRARLIPV